MSKNSYSNSILKIVGLIILISGLIIFGLSSYGYMDFKSFLNVAEVTNATILDKKLLHSYENGSICRFNLKIEYEVNDKLYHKNVDVVNPENDDIVEVYYDVTDPAKMHIIKDVDFIVDFYTVLITIGIIFFIAGIICLICFALKNQLNKIRERG